MSTLSLNKISSLDKEFEVDVKDLVSKEVLSTQGLSLIGPGTMVRGADKISLLQGGEGEEGYSALTRGLDVQLNETISGSGDVSTYKFNSIVVADDQVDAQNDGTPGTKVDGLFIRHTFGGPTTRGGRHAAEAFLIQRAVTAADNTDRNYVGLAASVQTPTGDGGTGGAGKGAYFGGNFVASNLGGSYILNLTACEFNTTTTPADGNGVHLHYGIQIVASHKERGYTRDAAIGISNKSTSTTTWRDGIFFGASNGAHPLGSDSRVIFVEENGGIRTGIELPTCSQSVLKSGNVDLTNNSLSVSSVNARVELGSTTTSGGSSIDMHSSGTAVDYDVRIAAAGGSSVVGAGSLQISAAEVVPNCVVRPAADNATGLGRADRRFTQVFAATGTINTSDEREKEQVRDLSASETAAALELKGMLKAFKWVDAVTKKGDNARWHFGVMAQEVERVFSRHGLDANAYAMFCYDEWDEVSEVLNEDGEVVQEGSPAGNRYGVRYDQLLAFIISAL